MRYFILLSLVSCFSCTGGRQSKIASLDLGHKKFKEIDCLGEWGGYNELGDEAPEVYLQEVKGKEVILLSYGNFVTCDGEEVSLNDDMFASVAKVKNLVRYKSPIRGDQRYNLELESEGRRFVLNGMSRRGSYYDPATGGSRKTMVVWFRDFGFEQVKCHARGVLKKTGERGRMDPYLITVSGSYIDTIKNEAKHEKIIRQCLKHVESMTDTADRVWIQADQPEDMPQEHPRHPSDSVYMLDYRGERSMPVEDIFRQFDIKY